MKRFWTARQVALLREMAPTHSSEEIGAKIGRTKNAVRHMACRLGVSIRDGKRGPPKGYWLERKAREWEGRL